LIVPSPLHRNARRTIAGALVLAAVQLIAGQPAGAFEEPVPFEFKHGDRVVLVGDTFIERDQRYGYLETLLTLAHSDLGLTIRNLGWSGDTVAGLSRAGFDPPEAGFRELKEHILAARPTVVIVGYGMADSFEGPSGVPGFVEGLNRLLDLIASTDARVVLLSPIAHEDLGRPLPDPAPHNRDLALYTQAIRGVAGQRGIRFVNLFDGFAERDLAGRDSRMPHDTDDGIHLTEAGYREAAHAIYLRLGQHRARPDRDVVIRGDGTVLQSRGARVTDVRVTGTGLRFESADDDLVQGCPVDSIGSQNDFRFPGLKPGRYILRVDGNEAARADATSLERGIKFASRPGPDQLALRQVINAKNRLFFYRWRPQNVTYLFGFRKHEQGNNAIEVPRFDPLVEEKEREIVRLCRPATHHYELIRESEVAK
jgi:lysophospholipase L1-like esterase